MRSRPIESSMGARAVWFALTLVCSSVATPVAARAAEQSLGDMAQIELLERTLADVADAVRPSVVAIRSERRTTSEEDEAMPDDEVHRGMRNRVFPAVGSGVIISADGLILTNEHVVQNAEPERITCILSDGESFRVRDITSDPRSDLAVLRIEATDLKPIRLGDVSNVRQGHFAIVMGNPFGSASDNHGRPAMSFGVVSALGQELTRQLDPMGERYYGNLIQTDARINPGNSGGPLLNIRGELIGINTAISTRSGGSEGVGYAISIDKRTKDIIDQLARGREVEYGYLGVDLDSPSPVERVNAGAPVRGGAIVREVRGGTPAAAASFKEGDVIVEFDGRRVQDRDHLVRLVGASRVGADISVLVYRDKQRMTLQVRPGRRPSEIRPINTYGSFEWRGMKLVELTPTTRREHHIDARMEGVLVTAVEPESAADKAGVEAWQVLRRIGDVPINGLRRLREISPNLEGPLKIVVAGTEDTELTLDE